MNDDGGDCEYLPKLGHFEELFDKRTSAALAVLPPDSPATAELRRYRSILHDALTELAGLYRAQYLRHDLAPQRAGLLTPLEANTAMVTQQNLEIMRRMLTARSGPAESLRLRMLTGWMARTSSSLQRRDSAPFSLLISVPQIMQAGRKPVGTVASLAASTILRRSVTAMTDALEPSNFLRSDDVRFEGIPEALRRLDDYPRAALILIANHDLGIYDITLARRLSGLLGCQHHMIMNRKTVYPLAPPDTAGDVIFVDEGDPRHRPVADSVRRIKESMDDGNTRVSLAVYPEGMLPFTGAQMPLVTKEGAFVIARKAAVELGRQDVPVLLVEANSNFLAHLTGREHIQPTLSVVDIGVVPATPLAKDEPDAWIYRRRMEAENRFNAGRGERMLDVFSSAPLAGSMTYEALGG